MSVLLCILLAIAAAGSIVPEHSLIPPFAQGAHRYISREWDLYGAVCGEKSIILTPNVPGRAGVLASTIPVTLQSFELRAKVRVSQPGKASPTQGGDGMAIFFSNQPIKSTGSFFGAPERVFSGVAVVLDTFDNAGSTGRAVPRLQMFAHDGKSDWSYEKGNNGQDQELGACVLKPALVRGASSLEIKVVVQAGSFFVFYGDGGYYESVSGQEAQERYLAFAGETGGLADQHEVLELTVHDLTPAYHNVKSVTYRAATGEKKTMPGFGKAYNFLSYKYKQMVEEQGDEEGAAEPETIPPPLVPPPIIPEPQTDTEIMEPEPAPNSASQDTSGGSAMEELRKVEEQLSSLSSSDVSETLSQVGAAISDLRDSVQALHEDSKSSEQSWSSRISSLEQMLQPVSEVVDQVSKLAAQVRAQEKDHSVLSAHLVSAERAASMTAQTLTELQEDVRAIAGVISLINAGRGLNLSSIFIFVIVCLVAVGGFALIRKTRRSKKGMPQWFE